MGFREVISRFLKRREEAWHDAWLNEHRWDALARYNAEIARGILHTARYQVLMAEEQRKFDAELRAGAVASGSILLRDQ